MAPEARTRLRSILGILWRICAFVVVFRLIGTLFIVLFDTALPAWREVFPIRVRLYGDATIAVAMLAATWVMTRLVDRRPFVTIGFAPRQAPRDLLIGLALGAVWLALSVGAAWLAGWASPLSPVTGSSSQLPATLTALFFNVLTQQMLLCGYIFQGTWLPLVNVFCAGALFCLASGSPGTCGFPSESTSPGTHCSGRCSASPSAEVISWGSGGG